MDMKQEAERIYHLTIDRDKKIRLLKDLALDCYNEMEAQDQNMHPEVHHKLSEGYRLAKDFIRKLEHD
ncbi:hypothetical protein [Legionella spiritensis]|uniref:hypothetical protein n=1 Tax=Legionella spiritensis TaxID=452 RepID=UPI000F6DB552|nr:hypothetical protein [Legionella spiritensis]VEG92073.1 Uncharacterised protein [Legionella spiritensis]